MSTIRPGEHVVVEFPDATVDAVILEVRGNEALVQERGTRRAEWAPINRIR